MEESETIDNNLKGTKIIISNVDIYSFETLGHQWICCGDMYTIGRLASEVAGC